MITPDTDHRTSFIIAKLHRNGVRLAVLAILLTATFSGCGFDLANLFPASWLYTQTGKQGTMTATEAEGHYIIKITDASPTTVGFADRPAHQVLSVPTASFVSQWQSLFASSPPNASIVFDESEHAYVFALSAPVFHPDDHTLWYHAELIPDAAAAPPPEQFDFASVFIDDAGQADSSPTNVVSQSVSLVSGGIYYEEGQHGTFGLHYSLLPTSNPTANQGRLWFFENVDTSAYFDVYTATPDQYFDFRSDAPTGYQNLDIERVYRSNLLAYSTGPSQSTICAVLPVSRELPSNSTGASTTISIIKIEGDDVELSYWTPLDNRPAHYDNWIGVWRGNFDPAAAPLYRADMSFPGHNSIITLEDTGIESGSTYTIVYFTGTEVSNAAATITFTN